MKNKYQEALDRLIYYHSTEANEDNGYNSEEALNDLHILQGVVNKEQLVLDVIEWIKDKKIDEARPADQMLKVVEEVGELAEGIAKDNMDLVIDALGDIPVTLLAVCTIYDLDLFECLRIAYSVIKDREGETINGIFVKKKDLKK